ncbi:mitochondrial chaperone BCS1 [Tenacibaculum phage pT24]|uniref:Mitochondrial chaperone BCS1 n=1 Tax=Tenacibaculum phage pT24 TaxID=1880590 RepID=A0A1B4XX70_9CAUD|nr:mitochondrial chaperone BCS1 [Tenacibaculum phage pT24]BAV39403.1 mitochondrial chaperone BCS1 [Tenacibaculum phage pT24]
MDLPTISELYAQAIELVKTNQMVQGGLVFSTLTSFFLSLPRYILPWLKRLYERIERLVVFSVTIEQTDDLFYYFEHWLYNNYETKYRNVEAVVKFNGAYSSNYDLLSGEFIEKEDEKVHFRQFEDLFYFRKGLNFIRIFKGREKLENANSIDNAHFNKFHISGLFAKKAITKLIKDIHEEAKTKMVEIRQKSIEVFSSSSYGDWIRETVVEPKKLENIIIEGKEALMADMEEFVNRKSWYRENELMYKRGYLFTGNAGTGKTTMIMSLSRHFNRPIYFLQLNNIDDNNLRTAFRNLPPKSFLVVEDADSAFDKRKSKSKFSFSTFLNCLDGAFSADDVMVIFTTNHPEKLDHALLRKGRMDFKMEFKRPSKSYVEKFLNRFYKDVDSKELVLPSDYNGMIPMVDVQDSCISNINDHEKAIAKIIESDKFVMLNGDPKDDVINFDVNEKDDKGLKKYSKKDKNKKKKKKKKKTENNVESEEQNKLTESYKKHRRG